MPPRLLLDPRTSLLLVVVLNALLLSGRVPWIEAPALGVLVVWQVFARRWRPAIVWAAVGAALFLADAVVPVGWPAALAASLLFLFRWAIAFGLGGLLIATTPPGALVAALRRVRVPDLVVVPVAVVLRFLPTLKENAGQVLDAMRLRGLWHGPQTLAVRPMATAEHLVVPLIATAVRSGDELAASAVTRGLGSPGRPTSVLRLGPTWRDAVMLVALAAIVLAALAPLLKGL